MKRPLAFSRLLRLDCWKWLPGLLVAWQPLLWGRLPQADAIFHLYWLAQLERAVQHGALFPRWLTDLGLGYGYPLFNYYAPLGDLMVFPLVYLGLSPQTALLISFGLALGGVVLGVYGWARELFGAEAGRLAALVVGYAPYLLVNVHHRGALAESWGLACLSLTAWGLLWLWREGTRRAWLLAVVSYAGLLLSHNLTALIGTGLLGGYVLLTAWGQQQWRGSLRVGLALALGLGLAAFFWLPAVLERDLVQYQIYTQARFDYRNFFLPLRDLLAGPRPVDTTQANAPVTIGLGWLLPLLALTGWLPTVRLTTRGERLQRAALTGAAVLLAGMTLRGSLPLWEQLPALRLMQYPWRLLGPASLALAIVAGLGLSRLPGPAWGRLLLTLAVVSGFAVAWLLVPPPTPEPSLTPPDTIRFEARTGGIGATAGGEFLPRWVEQLPPAESLLAEYEAAAPAYLIARLDPASLPPGATVTAAHYGYTTAEVMVESGQAFTARFRWYYFPGWQAWVDGRPQPTVPAGPHGLLSVAVPAGRHQLRVAFGDTPLRQWANRLSLLSLVVGVALLVWRRPASAAGSARPAAPLPAWAWGAYLGLSLLLLGLKTGVLDRYPSWLNLLRFDGQRVRGVSVPLQIRFGTELELLGYDLPATTFRADEPVPLALYWRALGPVSADYSVAVHLVAADGQLYGQHDAQNPAGYPTRFLRLDQYLRDVHSLRPWAGTPPGRYTVLVSLYQGATGQNLEVWDAEGRWLGVSFPVAELQLTPPTTFPDPATLPLERTLNVDLGAGLRLVGTGSLPERLAVGEILPLALYWQALQSPAGTYQARLRLLTATGEVAAEAVVPPGGAAYPTSAWRAGEVVRQQYDFRIPAARLDQPTLPLLSGSYTVEVALVDGTARPLAAPVALGEVTVAAPPHEFQVPPLAHPLAYRFGELATLLGYTLEPTALQAGQPCTLTLVWRAETLTTTAYSVFVHLIDETGTILAQQDNPPVHGGRPTTGWLPGEVLRDEYGFTLPATAGAYRLCVGLYNPHNLQRLISYTPEGAPAGDYLCLPDGLPVNP